MTALRTALIRTFRISDPTPDAELVRAAAAGDSEAYSAIIGRHGPMVMRVCQQVLGNAHSAEDTFQAVFLLLSRRAGRLKRPERLAAWLFGTARHVAKSAKRSMDRRRRHESRATPAPTRHPLTDLTARELLLALDEEIERLPEAYRLPLLLCYWQGLKQNDIARRLGWSPASVKGRLERGRKCLATRLAKRGLAPASILMASLASSVLPGELMARTAALAISGAAVPTTVLKLAASGSAFITAWKWAASLTVLCAAIAGIGSASHFESAAPNSSTTLPEAQAAPQPQPNYRLATQALRDAEQVLAKVQDDAMERVELWCNIARLYVKFNDLASARSALGNARAVWTAAAPDKERALLWLGTSYASLGDANEVLALAKRAKASHEGVHYQHSCMAAVHFGQTKAALQIADAMEGPEYQKWFRSYALRRASLEPAKPDKLAAAVEVINELPKDEYKAYAQVGTIGIRENDTGVALAQFEAGDLAGARRSIREALAVGAGLPNPQSERVIAAAIRAMARMNDLDAAEKESARLTVPQLQLIAAIEIAKAQIRAGKESAALRLVEKFQDGEDRAALHYEIGFEFDQGGNKTKASANFRQAEKLLPANHAKRILFLSKIAKSGNFNLAMECVAEAEKESEREAESFMGDSARKMVLDRMYNLVDFDWLTVATEQAKKGDFASAMETATQRVKTRSRRGECLSEIAKEQTRAGQEGNVRNWIARENDPLFRAYSLVGLAQGLHR